MFKKLLIKTITIVSIAGITSLAHAAENASANNELPAEMAKDKWLSAISPLLPELICKGFMQDSELKKRFEEIKMTYEQCLSAIPESMNKCQAELYSKIPANLNSESAGVWGKALGECIGKDFALKYLIPKSS